MKNYFIIIVLTMISLTGVAQVKNTNQPEKLTKYITTFPNGDEAITIIESNKSNILKLTSSDNFYKYEILGLSNHELVHKSSNVGKVCDIDKTKLEKGNYTLKVYTSEFMISSDIIISNKNGDAVRVVK